MAHRGLIATQRSDGRYDLYRDAQVGFELDVAQPVGLDPVLVATDLDRESVLAHVDPLVHGALFVVADDVRAYRVLRFAVPCARTATESPDDVGALVAVGDIADPEPDGYLRGWFEATREAVGELVDRGLLDDRNASTELRDRLRHFAGSDVEVIVLPPGR